MHVRRLDPHQDGVVTERLLAACYPALVSSAARDQPFEPVPTPAAWRGSVLAPWSGAAVRLLVVEGSDGTPLGHLVAELPRHDNTHTVLVDVHVAFEHRRRGIGRALWAAVAELARDEGRSTVIGEARVGTPMAAFLGAVGAEGAIADARRHQPIGELDLEVVRALRAQAQQAAAGYRLESFVGPIPADRRAGMATAIMAINDAPTGSLDYQPEQWDAARVAERDAAIATWELRLHSLLAVAPGGAPCGYTDVAVSADGRYAWQDGTAVQAAHRGHRLGLLLKAAMVEQLRALQPELRVVSTWNAEENRHMIAINEALGYRVVDRGGEWQQRIDAGAGATGVTTSPSPGTWR